MTENAANHSQIKGLRNGGAGGESNPRVKVLEPFLQIIICD